MPSIPQGKKNQAIGVSVMSNKYIYLVHFRPFKGTELRTILRSDTECKVGEIVVLCFVGEKTIASSPYIGKAFPYRIDHVIRLTDNSESEVAVSVRSIHLMVDHCPLAPFVSDDNSKMVKDGWE